VRFKIPVYTNAIGCPAISSATIKAVGCSASSTDFTNAADITGSPAGGFWYAEVADAIGSSATTIDFCLIVNAGSYNVQASSLKLVIIDCTSSTYTSAETLVNEQTAVVGPTDMRFKVPIFTNPLSGCPAVVRYILYLKGTTTVSAFFSNAADLSPTLDNGFVYGTLTNDAVAGNYGFDL